MRTKATCDVCEKHPAYGGSLNRVQERFQSRGLTHICDKCAVKIDRFFAREESRAMKGVRKAVKAKLKEMRKGR
jgi:protein-arginine kinase activator protein McsA